MENPYPVIDANLNRLSEGLRVIEEYARFIAAHAEITQTLSKLRKTINDSEYNPIKNLAIRNTANDMRANEAPRPRKNYQDLLKANFKRCQEACRVLEEITGKGLYTDTRYTLYTLEKEMVLTLLKPKINKGIYLISSELEVLEKGLKAGVSLVQLRDKAASKETLLNKATKLKALSKSHSTPIIINDFLDIAQLVDADGFHSGQDDISVKDIRQLWGPHKLIGRTTHSLQEGLIAQKEGADYVSVGPIWETPSKPDREGIGFSYLSEAKNRLSIPFVAIGGVHLDNMNEILPHRPPMIGLIRDHGRLEDMMAAFSSALLSKEVPA